MARHRDTSYLKNWNCAGFAHGGNHRIASETKQAKLDYSMGGLGGPRAMSDLGGTFQVSGFRFQVSGFRVETQCLRVLPFHRPRLEAADKKLPYGAFEGAP